MTRPSEQEIRDLAAPLRLPAKCASPYCTNRTVYRGQFCAVCRSQQEATKEMLRLKREASHAAL